MWTGISHVETLQGRGTDTRGEEDCSNDLRWTLGLNLLCKSSFIVG